MIIRSYKELSRLQTFDERFEYLTLKSEVGKSTFGFERYMNQRFYASTEWKQCRSFVIARDEGKDLGCEGYEIFNRIIIHHINPMSPDDIEHSNPMILDPDNLITTTHRTHNAIHFGVKSALASLSTERTPGDTILW